MDRTTFQTLKMFFLSTCRFHLRCFRLCLVLTPSEDDLIMARGASWADSGWKGRLRAAHKAWQKQERRRPAGPGTGAGGHGRRNRRKVFEALIDKTALSTPTRQEGLDQVADADFRVKETLKNGVPHFVRIALKRKKSSSSWSS